jgi:hypothetical protein
LDIYYLKSHGYCFRGLGRYSKVECTLFGEYVDLLKCLIGEKLDGLRVLIIQFAKVKIFRGMFCIFKVQFQYIFHLALI